MVAGADVALEVSPRTMSQDEDDRDLSNPRDVRNRLIFRDKKHIEKYWDTLMEEAEARIRRKQNIPMDSRNVEISNRASSAYRFKRGLRRIGLVVGLIVGLAGLGIGIANFVEDTSDVRAIGLGIAGLIGSVAFCVIVASVLGWIIAGFLPDR